MSYLWMVLYEWNEYFGWNSSLFDDMCLIFKKEAFSPKLYLNHLESYGPWMYHETWINGLLMLYELQVKHETWMKHE